MHSILDDKFVGSGTKLKLLICDLDNTLYDWVDYFVPSLQAMVRTASNIMECNEVHLIADLRAVHQQHRNTEHPYSLFETHTYLDWATKEGDEARRRIDPAFHAFNSMRKKKLKLYDGVMDVFIQLRDAGIEIVGYSDSGYYGVLDRLRRLELIDFFKFVFCTPKSSDSHAFQRTSNEWSEPKLIELHSFDKKPNPEALLNIASRLDVNTNEILYIGDSLSKDVWMANQAGIATAWAKYGTRIDTAYYEWLVLVSHWTSEDVKREKEASYNALNAKPDCILEHSISELLNAQFIVKSKQQTHLKSGSKLVEEFN